MHNGSVGPATIFALSSAPGKAGVAVVRLSGPDAGGCISAMAGTLPRARTAALRTLRFPETGEPLDRALVLWFPAPSSFTGEDVAEFHVHGSRAVVQGLFDSLSHLGARLAEPGEFTKRAFANAKMDLTEAEGLADLIAAETTAQRRQALAQAEGSLRSRFEAWRGKLVQAMALVEASLDFSDEADVADDAMRLAVPLVAGLHIELAAALHAGRGGEIIREGIRVAIIGEPNVGKSSLLNALAGRQAAIVFDEPGTTRDVIEVTVDIGGYPFVFQDTAGLRETASAIEREGIRRSLNAASQADIVIEVRDASRAPEGGNVATMPPDTRPTTALTQIVYNKADLAPPPRSDPSAVCVSAKTGEGLDTLKGRLSAIARDAYGQTESAIITRSRHRELLEASAASLRRFLAANTGGEAAELLAEELRTASVALGRLTGAVDAEEVLGAIFAEFCIGK